MKESRRIIGLMTGTSLDGIDAALVEVAGAGLNCKVKLIHFICVPFPAEVRRAILQIAAGKMVTAGDISQLNFLLGQLYADAVFKLSRESRCGLQQVDLIGSHGQTVYHQSEPSSFCGRRVASTLQIGEPSILAEQTGLTVVAGFRPRDMAAGGKGAPLIPYVDYLLFRDNRLGRVLLNIGGISNLTSLPAAAKLNHVRAFDTGPGNMVIDALVQHATRGEKQYDGNGRMARQGRVVRPLLAELLAYPYFKLAPPKTAGREQFGEAFLARLLRHASDHPLEDLVATATELTAASITQAIQEFVLPRNHVDQLIVSGGGGNNQFLLERLQAGLPKLAILTSNELGIPSDAKEAVGFAVLANETFNLRPGNVPTATGARHPVILGKVVYGNNYGRLRGF